MRFPKGAAVVRYVGGLYELTGVPRLHEFQYAPPKVVCLHCVNCGMHGYVASIVDFDTGNETSCVMIPYLEPLTELAKEMLADRREIES